MKIKCIYNTGKDLVKYQSEPLRSDGQFLTDSQNRSLGCSAHTQFGGLEIGKEYLVMGMFIRNGLLWYLIDDGNIYPYLLFEVTDNKVNQNWYFRSFTKDDDNYVNREIIWGYYELCFEEGHYIQLLEKEEKAMLLFFKRKIEIENAMLDKDESKT